MKAKLVWVSLFSIAMGFLETAVVVYLRQLYYPEGFDFPLKEMSGHIVGTELLREAATLIMLVGIGVLAGRTKSEKFGYFIYSFAIWDIFYYIFLKLLLSWPQSLLTWDVLFLIPSTWVGPVVCPLLLSLAMIVLGLSIVYFTQKSAVTVIRKTEWGFLTVGSILCIVSFTYEYSKYILTQYSLVQLFVPGKEIMDYAIQYVPLIFPWWIFAMGFIIIIAGIVKFVYRNLQKL